MKIDFSQLNTLGYQVIPRILDQSEVDQGRSLFQGWIDHNKPDPRNFTHGIIQHYNCGQSAFAWFTRTNQKVQGVFQQLWGANDLVVSFDGQCYWPQGTKKKNSHWLHIDQRLDEPNRICVQGLVSYTTNNQGSITLIPGSHKIVEQGYFLGRPGKKSFNRITEDEVPNFGEPITIAVGSGDMVIWDSRVLHQNKYSEEERLVQYVCYLPRAGLTQAQATKRRDYFTQGRTTSHWPYPIRVNSRQPQVYSNKDRLIDYDKVGESPKGLDWLKEHQSEINKLV